MPTRPGISVGALALLAAGAGAQVEYDVAVIDTDGELNIIAFGINNEGKAVGWYNEPWPEMRAFEWTPGGGLALLPPPPGEDRYYARTISDTGIIGGGYEFGRPWTFANGAFNTFGGAFDDVSGEVWGVNDAGDAAGTIEPGDLLDFTAFFYDSGADEVVQVASRGSRAYGVNDAGVVAGHSGGRAFRWTRSGGVEFLGAPDATYTTTLAFAINDASTVVGEAKDPTSGQNSRGYANFEGRWQIIPPIGAVNRAWGVNRHDSVVGESQHTGFGDKGWIWTPQGGTRQLDELIHPAIDMNIVAAFDINDHGQIAAYAFDNSVAEFVAIVLTPQGAACPADMDGDGDADVNDFFLYLGLFEAGDARADITGDGTVDVNDYFAYLDLFASGCD